MNWPGLTDFIIELSKRKHLERGEEGLSAASSGACREYPPQRHWRSHHSLLTNNKQIAFSIPVACPFGVTVQPRAVITAARGSPSASTRLPAVSLRRSSHQALQMPSLVEGLGEHEQ